MLASPVAMRWLSDDTRRRRLLLALGLYVVTTAVFFAFAAPSTLHAHTPWNHFALLANAWLKGRFDLGGRPPAYTGNNDFAEYGGKWFVVFPPFPAVLLLPLVAVAGSAERVRDGQFFLWLAGVGPAVLFLGLEKLRRTGRSERSILTNLLLCLLFSFGTVYFFTAEQGTVWYAAHVVAVALAALYLLWALDAEHPFGAGVAIALGFLTRSPLLFAVPLFALEAGRVCLRSSSEMVHEIRRTGRAGELEGLVRRLDKARLARLYASFACPVAAALAFAFWYNHSRFGRPLEFGYRYLTVAWRVRMNKWGLFNYHYLAKNLGVVLTSLPWVRSSPSGPPWQINGHGLALWVTSPIYLWLIWPKKVGPLHVALWITIAAVAVPTLFYQNTGWVQFGYRFSNDYAIFLFALLAIGGRRFRTLFWGAALWSLGVNAFGAASFNRAAFSRYYYIDSSQTVFYQPD